MGKQDQDFARFKDLPKNWPKFKFFLKNNTIEEYTFVSPKNMTEICPLKKSPMLFIGIESSQGDFTQRRLIRTQSWALYQSNTTDFKYVFLVGASGNTSLDPQLKEEMIEFGDVIWGSFVDSYFNLTRKSIFGLNVAITLCPSAKFYMKTDTDVFINIYNVLNFIYSAKPQKLLFGLPIDKKQLLVKRDPAFKWAMPYEWYNKPYYPQYLDGPAYIVSMDVAQKLAEAAPTQRILWLEDLMVTGILRQAIDLPYTGLPHEQMQAFIQDFAYVNIENWDGVEVLPSWFLKYYWVHPCTRHQLVDMWKRIQPYFPNFVPKNSKQ